MKSKEEKQDKKELDFEVHCIVKANDFPITLTCKRGSI